jgi:hypothetical protein
LRRRTIPAKLRYRNMGSSYIALIEIYLEAIRVCVQRNVIRGRAVKRRDMEETITFLSRSRPFPFIGWTSPNDKNAG